MKWFRSNAPWALAGACVALILLHVPGLGSLLSLAGSEAAPSLQGVEFHIQTSVLEYSLKDTDPVGLVESPPVEGIQITTEDHLDLSRLGDQKITYLARLNNEEAEFEVTYTVRDTKSPDIRLQSPSLTISMGDAFDPASNVASVTDSVDGPLALLTEPPERLTSDDLGRAYENGWYVITGDLDTDVPGTYFLTVEARDNHDNVTTKEFSVTVEQTAGETAEPEPATTAPAEGEPHEQAFILNTNTHRFHYPSCSSVQKMSEKNKQEFTGTREELIAQGYKPCGNCNP